MDESFRALVRRLATDPSDHTVAKKIEDELDRGDRWRNDRDELYAFEALKGGTLCLVKCSCVEEASNVLKFWAIRAPVEHEVQYTYLSCMEHANEVSRLVVDAARGRIVPGRRGLGYYPGFGVILRVEIEPIPFKSST